MDRDGAVGLAYPRKMVEHIILGLSNPVNRHLIKLIAFDFPPAMRQQFRRELRTRLRDIRTLKFKSNKRPGPSKFYFEPLCEYPFGGGEIENVKVLMDAISEDYEAVRPKTAGGGGRMAARVSHAACRAAASGRRRARHDPGMTRAAWMRMP
jgi:hypothetical protein